MWKALVAAIALSVMAIVPARATTLALTNATYSDVHKFGTASLASGYGSTTAISSTSPIWTVETWVNQPKPATGSKATLQVAAAFGSAFVGSVGSVAVATPGTGSINGADIADGNWHHLALTCVNNVGTFFVDDQPQGTDACSPLNNPVLHIGSIQGSSQYAWNGLIDQTAVFDTPLYQGTASPPTTPFTGNEPGLLALFGFDNVATDSTVPGGTTQTDGTTVTPANGVTVLTPDISTANSALNIAGTYQAGGVTPAFSYQIDQGDTIAVSPALSTDGYAFAFTAPAPGNHSVTVSMTVSGTTYTAATNTFQTALASTLRLSNLSYSTNAPKFGSGFLSSGTGGTTPLQTSSSNWTLDAYVTLPATTTGTSLAIAAAGGSAYMGAFGSTAIANVGGGYVNGPLIADGLWHHLAVSCAAGIGTFLVDDTPVGSNTCSALSNPKLYVGSLQGNSSYYPWVGGIDQVAFLQAPLYQGAVSPASLPFTGAEPGMLALYQFDGDSTDKTIATTTPALTIDTPNTATVNGSMTVMGSFAVASGTPSFHYLLDSGSNIAVTPVLSGNGYTFTITAPPIGSHILSISMTTNGSTLTATSGAFLTVNGTPLVMTTPAYSTTITDYPGASLFGGYGTATVAAPGGSWTIEAEVRNTPKTALQIAMAAGTPFMGMDGVGFAYASLGNGLQVSTTRKINDGLWHHMAIVDDAGMLGFYLDGTLMGGGAGGFGLMPTINVGQLQAGYYQWFGQIDQAAFWNFARYSGQQFTPPNAPYTGTEAGLLNLWSFDQQNGYDTAAFGASTAPALTIATPIQNSPTQSAVLLSGTYNGPAPSGVNISANHVNYVALTGFSASSGHWSGYWTSPAAPSTVTLTAQESNAPNLTATTDAFSVAGFTTFAPNNPAIFYSPMNWTQPTATVTSAINAGAYFKTVFSGAGCQLTFDVSNMGIPATEVRYRIDGSAGGGWIQTPVQAIIPCPIPAITATASTHSLEFVIKSTGESLNRWNAPSNVAVNFTGLQLYKGGSIQAPIVSPISLVFYGDSITEGVRAVSLISAADVDQNDAMATWDWYAGTTLGSEFGIIGFGSSGLQSPGAGNVPVLNSSWNLIMAGKQRNFISCPTAFVINEGTNDAYADPVVEQSQFVRFFGNLLSSCPKSKILALIPFDGAQAAAIMGAVTQVASSQVVYIQTPNFFNYSLGTFDNLHPSATNDIAFIGPKVVQALRSHIYPSGASHVFH